MKFWFSIVLLILLVLPAASQGLEVSSGRLVRIENFPSQFITARNIDVWLPDHYAINKKYRVVYMQDGQNLFTSAHLVENEVWNLDITLDSLYSTMAIEDCIVVGIWNNPEFYRSEYFPEKIFERMSTKKRKSMLSDELHYPLLSDDYLRFVVFELKPYIDRNFPVLSSRENTNIAGSRDGGLMSLYAVCEYPEIFHSASCLSLESFDESILKALLSYLRKKIPDSKSHKIYFDFLLKEDKPMTSALLRKLDALFKKKNYTSENYINKQIESYLSEYPSKNPRFFDLFLFLLKRNNE